MIYIIAEAAQGYEGSIDIAKLLVKGAAYAKADAIKFQIVFASDLCEPGYKHYELFRQLEMTNDEWMNIRQLAKKKNIDFIADVFGSKSLEIAENIGVDAIKLHSTNFFDDRLNSAVFGLHKKTYLSVGGIFPNEIDAFISKYDLKTRDDITILFGFQAEPTPINLNNLSRIKKLKEKTRFEVGFMDHSEAGSSDDLCLSVLALGMGVRVFEKHITLNRELKLEDYISGLEPSEFLNYVESIHRLKGALGNSDLTLTEEELEYRSKTLKRAVASRNIRAGEILTENDFRLTRPTEQSGVYVPQELLGKVLKVNVKNGDPISKEMLS